MNEDERLMFWAYKHISGHIHVKRFTDQAAVDDAYDSDFVDSILDPYTAKDRREAEQIALNKFGKTVA